MTDDGKIDVNPEKAQDGSIQFKVTRNVNKSNTTLWLTRGEAEDLHAQLEKVLYKGG